MKMLGKPQPDSDVINKEPKVLLIGAGWVGQYCGKYFKTADIYTKRGWTKREFNHYDLAIISVPTPMNSKTGQCDTSIVESCVANHKSYVDYFLIKSTVELGTTDYLKERYKVKIAMSPEYIGETLGHPLLKPKRDTFLIIGGQKGVREAIADMWMTVLHSYSQIFLCEALEAELIKYLENYWIMRRVDYWNEVFELSRIFGVSFHALREGLVLDPRLGRTHSFVYKNNRGWAGKCLPKDMNALAYKLRQKGEPLETLEHLIEKNAKKWRAGYKNKERLMPEKK